MGWFEKDNAGLTLPPDEERATLLNEVRKESLPIVEREAKEGAPKFQPMKFQPVRSPGIYEAEFAVRNDDLIFHFWPWGFHKAQKGDSRLPKFAPTFTEVTRSAMGSLFGAHRVLVEEDPDMGSVFVKATGWGSSQFQIELSIKACEAVHKGMGGTEG